MCMGGMYAPQTCVQGPFYSPKIHLFSLDPTFI